MKIKKKTLNDSVGYSKISSKKETYIVLSIDFKKRHQENNLMMLSQGCRKQE